MHTYMQTKNISTCPTHKHRYPDEYVLLCIDIMASQNIPASKMPEIMRKTFATWLSLTPEDSRSYDWGDVTTHGKWRETVPYMCLVQCGMSLTAVASKAGWTLLQDGSPIMGRHVEAFVITAKDVKISMLPWVQADKAGATGASGTRSMLERAQKAYPTFYFGFGCERSWGTSTPTSTRVIVNACGKRPKRQCCQ